MNPEKEWGACKAISIRKETSPEEKSRLTSLANLYRISSGSHNFLGPDMNKQLRETGVREKLLDAIRELVAEGKHNFQSAEHKNNNSKIQRGIQTEKFKNGIHALQTTEIKERARRKTIELRAADRRNKVGFFSDENPSKTRVSFKRETTPSALKQFHKHLG